MERAKFWIDGKPHYLESRHEEKEGRHVIIDRWVDAETGETHKEMEDTIRDLFSPTEKLDERLISQEVSAIYLRDGVVPEKMYLGDEEFRGLCESLYPKTPPPIPGYKRPSPEENKINSIVTTVGQVQIVHDMVRSGYRSYVAEDGKVLEVVME